MKPIQKIAILTGVALVIINGGMWIYDKGQNDAIDVATARERNLIISVLSEDDVARYISIIHTTPETERMVSLDKESLPEEIKAIRLERTVLSSKSLGSRTQIELWKIINNHTEEVVLTHENFNNLTLEDADFSFSDDNKKIIIPPNNW